MTTTTKDFFRHYLNPLHVYCRIKPVFGKRWALVVANKYEPFYKLVFK